MDFNAKSQQEDCAHQGTNVLILTVFRWGKLELQCCQLNFIVQQMNESQISGEISFLFIMHGIFLFKLFIFFNVIALAFLTFVLLPSAVFASCNINWGGKIF